MEIVHLVCISLKKRYLKQFFMSSKRFKIFISSLTKTHTYLIVVNTVPAATKLGFNLHFSG